jgi:hypothetical protein
MRELDELDKPHRVTGEDGITVTAPADFESMTPEQRRGWPQRSYIPWRRYQVLLMLVPIGLGIVAGLLYRSWSVLAQGAVMGFRRSVACFALAGLNRSHRLPP